MYSKDLLKSVSRSFSLSLLSLPASKRDFVGDVYLVARVADSIADSGSWSSLKRLSYLEAWEKALFHSQAKSFSISDSVGSFQESEARLLLEAPKIAEKFLSYSEKDRAIAIELLKSLFRAMRFIIDKFSSASKKEPVFASETRDEFDFYCYGHAGCVGSFWVQIFGLPLDLEAFAVDYGKALERINVLRDLKSDREKGHIFLPKKELEKYGLHTSEPWREKAWGEYLEAYIQETRALFLRGMFFCDSIRYGQFRLRWASMMPLKIGVHSLDFFWQNKRDVNQNKISRTKVYQLAVESLLDVFLNRKLNKYFSKRKII